MAQQLRFDYNTKDALRKSIFPMIDDAVARVQPLYDAFRKSESSYDRSLLRKHLEDTLNMLEIISYIENQ